jgi:hypothetical protein
VCKAEAVLEVPWEWIAEERDDAANKKPQCKKLPLSI